MRRPLVPNRVWRLAAAFTLAGITVAQNAGRSSGPGSQTQKQAPENLRTGLGISVASDEVLRVAVQLGVRDVVIYGGPGSGKVPGTDRKLNKPRADYQDYLELRQRLESHGLRLAAIEGGFVHLAKYHDIVFGGPRRDELIDELAAEIRDMGRAGVPAYGYNWMASLVWRTKPVRIRGGAEATAFNYANVKDVQNREGCEAARKTLNWFLMTCENTPARGEQKPAEEEMWRNLEHWIRKITPVAERAGIRIAGDKPFPGNLGGYRSRMFAVGYIESLIDASAPQTERAGSTARDR